ncbi:MAG: hypothetical protein EAZ62_06585 [Sphingobacteriia bacterium]|nr:MAG: hypothetical protein EAZ62_06585 [Sphingobacteriia bacterium]
MTESPNEDFFAQTQSELEAYVRNRAMLAKMQAADLVSRLVAKMVLALVLGGILFFVLLFFSIMGGYFFGDLTGSIYLGFAIVVGFYVLVFLVLVMLRKAIGRSIINAIIQTIFDNKESL